MARPKKVEGEPSARERIIEAFWGLLEQKHISRIGIKEIDSAAGCNRATFYYYFRDIYALLREAVVTELFGEGNVARYIVATLSQQDYTGLLNEKTTLARKRISVAIRQGGSQAVQEIVLDEVYRMWGAVLCCPAQDLKPTTRMLIRYAACGVMGVLFQGGEEESDQGAIVHILSSGLPQQVVPLLVSAVCAEQGVDVDEVRPRLAMLNSLPDLPHGRAIVTHAPL